MNKQLFLMVLCLGIMVYSCNELQNPISTVSTDDSIQLSANNSNGVLLENIVTSSIDLNNYEISFDGKVYDEEANQSTFSYTVSGTGVEPAMNNFFLETPACAGVLQAYLPTQSAKVTEEGITWEASLSTSESRSYSVTFSGDLPVGGINATIESGNSVATKEIPGPCKGFYTISGSVYVDANENEQKGLSESGIQNVTVYLNNGDGLLATQTTSTNGSFLFNVFAGSSVVNFTLTVPEITDNSVDFNDQLFDLYSSTTVPPELTVVVDNADVSAVDFGFTPQTEKMIQQFEDGTIQLKTEEPKFWIKQLRFAKNNNSNTEIPAADLNNYLSDIEQLLLDDPFQFGDKKIEAALNILTRPLKTDLEKLMVQLLTAELNVVSGRGSNSLDFDLALLAFGEAAALEELDSQALLKSSTTVTISSISTSDAERLLTSYNFSGGGGGGVGN